MDHPFLADSAADLVAYLGRQPPPLFVGIDGFSGAGKSTVAAFVADHAPASILHVDDFYADLPEVERLGLDAEEGYARYFDWERLRSVLLELSAGQEVRFDRFDWSSGCGMVEGGLAPPAPLVIVEGVYSCRPELSGIIHVKVLVEAPESVRRARREFRPDLAPWPVRWDAAERYYFDNVRLRQDFDVILSGHVR